MRTKTLLLYRRRIGIVILELPASPCLHDTQMAPVHAELLAAHRLDGELAGSQRAPELLVLLRIRQLGQDIVIVGQGCLETDLSLQEEGERTCLT